MALLAWFAVLRFVLRRLQALALRVPGARLGSRGLSPVGPTWGAGSIAALAARALLAEFAVLGSCIRNCGRAYWVFAKASPRLSGYVLEFLRWDARLGAPLVLLGVLHFFQENGWTSSRLGGGRRPGELPRIPPRPPG